MKTLGIFGGGQLGRLIAQAAKPLGWRTAALDSDPDAPALKVVDHPVVAPLDDPASAAKLAAVSDLLTVEWENVPVAVLEAAAKLKPVHPAPSVLGIIQDRLTQRDFLKKHGLPQTEYGEAAASPSPWPYAVVLKRRRLGYDGKGQCVVDTPADLPKAAGLLQAPCIWEKKVAFAKEVSVIIARGQDGETRCFPVAENEHRGGVLHATYAPARVPEAVAARARDLARKAAEALGHTGVMGVEMFLLPSGELLVNELAPRVHNSGHYTLDACATSQFEQHARAVCGLPLGPVEQKAPAVMVNLLGDLWAGGEPRWDTLEKVSGLTLHLYGKSSARPGRKMGHYTVTGPGAEAELAAADARLAALRR
ncbi:MAG: 5-(carboxyamino)imidazole ribonucleotide synthase [Elusimicrobiota bacterium]|nr:5-(carboxyamino)imidazole ribonucleotide synthase [Elusimicrobiota bacterium]